MSSARAPSPGSSPTGPSSGRTLGQHAESLAEARRALDLRLELVRDRPANVADRLRATEILTTVAQKETQLGHSEAGLEALRRAGELLDAIRRDNPRNPRILFALAKLNRSVGLALHGLGRVEETLKMFESTHPILEDLVSIEPGVPDNHAELAGNEYSLGLLLDVGRQDRRIPEDLR